MRVLRSKAFWFGGVLLVAFVVQTVMLAVDEVKELRVAQATRLAEQGDKPIHLLRPGDCFFVPDEGDRLRVWSQRCSNPHEAEVFARFELDGEAYPGDEVVRAEARYGCAAEFEVFTGYPYDMGTHLRIFSFRPDEAGWTTQSDRTVTCAVVDPSGPTQGTLRGASAQNKA